MYRPLLAQLRAFRAGDSAIEALRHQAADTVGRADHDRAEALLAQVEAAQLEAARQAQRIAEGGLLDAATTRAERGQVSLARLDYLTAADHFREAADLVPPGHADVRADYLRRQADALYEHSLWKGDNAALIEKQCLSQPWTAGPGVSWGSAVRRPRGRPCPSRPGRSGASR